MFDTEEKGEPSLFRQLSLSEVVGGKWRLEMLTARDWSQSILCNNIVPIPMASAETFGVLRSSYQVKHPAMCRDVSRDESRLGPR